MTHEKSGVDGGLCINDILTIPATTNEGKSPRGRRSTFIIIHNLLE